MDDITKMKLKLEVLKQAEEEGKSIKEVLEEQKKNMNSYTKTITTLITLVTKGLKFLGCNQEPLQEIRCAVDEVETEFTNFYEWDESTIKTFQKYINKE